MKLSNSISAVITGGGSGLGEGTARALSSAGVKVGILDVNAEAGERIAAELGGVFASADVADPKSVTDALALVRATNGQERICVNCAGIAPAAKTVDREGAAHDAALYAKIIGVNLIGTFNVASQCAAGMVKADPLNEDGERGVIINTASVAAFDGQIGQIAYGSSKAGVAGMTLPMARDLSRRWRAGDDDCAGHLWNTNGVRHAAGGAGFTCGNGAVSLPFGYCGRLRIACAADH